MRRQRNIFQIKGQDKTSEEEPCIMKTGNLPDKEFKVMIIKMLTKLRRMNEHSENSPIIKS